jgi:rubrerythrin
MNRKEFESIINRERMNYHTISTDTLQWLLKLTDEQIKSMKDRKRAHQARITNMAVRQELKFREDILRDELKLVTTPDFWDCECEEDFIHPSSDEACPVCGAHRDEQPDSRVNEVSAMLGDGL